jgi:hypothetical protein
MAQRCVARTALVLAGLGCLGWGAPAVAQPLGVRARQQFRAIYADRARLTPAQRKLDTSLLYAGRESRGQAMVPGLAPLRRVADRAGVGRDGTVIVDIRAEVTDGLLRSVRDLGGRVLSSRPAFGSLRARLPIQRVEALAELAEVRFIGPRHRFVVNAGTQTSRATPPTAAQ